MARVLELMTVNVAVRDQGGAVSKYRQMGLHAHPPNVMPEPPSQITDVSLPLGDCGAISVIAPTDERSPVQSFLDRRGEGIYSIAIRVDDLREAMSEWGHLDWVLPEPFVLPEGMPVLDMLPEKALANWIKPNSLHGVLMEVFEISGPNAKWKPAVSESR